MKPKAYSYIRFSTKGQIEGRSLKRQFEKAKKYADSKDLDLDSTIQDLGVSSFRGDNRKKGALGGFLERIKTGDIADGSILIIENMDRLSRDNPFEAYDQFRQIIYANITIAILSHPYQEYTKNILKTKTGALKRVIDEIERAHEESKRKSELLSDAWEEKRQLILKENRKMTSRVPMWLNKDDLSPKKDVCRAIERIYDMILAGKGKTAIANSLNKDPKIWKPLPSKTNKTGGWKTSTISRYLHDDQRLIGQLQLYKLLDGKRVKEGEPIKDYYPQVISEETYYKVKKLIKNRALLSGQAGGKTGKATNLFVHLVRCGLCGNTLHFYNKGKRGGNRLYCSNRHGIEGCKAKPVPYDEFEDIIFTNFIELDISRLFPGDDEIERRLIEIDDRIGAKEGKIQELDDQNFILVKRISMTKNEHKQDAYDKVMGVNSSKKKELEEENLALKMEMDSLRIEGQNQKERFDTVKEVRQQLMIAKDEEEITDIRLRLRETLRLSIEKIQVYPLMEKEEEIEYLRKRLNKLNEQSKQMGDRILAAALIAEIKLLEMSQEELELEHSISIQMDSKYIDKVIIRFRGPGIQEQDKYKEMIKRRTVRLRRYEITDINAL